jgi:recombination protein RecR
MDSLRRLEEIFARFPGIGPRQARRFVYHMLGKSPASVKEFTDLIAEVKKSTSECEMCHRFFMQRNLKGASDSKCSICSDSSRDRSTLMIVARDSDFEAIEKSSAYKGLYFILGGTVPILDKEPEKRIRLKSLLERVADIESVNGSAGNESSTSTKSASQSQSTASSSTSNSPFKEIILSLNTTPDGEHTADIVHEAILKMTENPSFRLSVLGRGLSTGAELEYVDGETIKNALKNRT